MCLRHTRTVMMKKTGYSVQKCNVQRCRENAACTDQKYLAGKYKKTQVELEFEKKPELIAGFVLRVGDIEEDFSIRGRLDRLQQKLTWR